jgi:hypothetical protein
MKRIVPCLLTTIFLWLGSFCIATGQIIDDGQIIQNDSTVQSDQIIDDGQIIQNDNTATGEFQPVTVDPSGTSDVALQFSPSKAGQPVLVQPLDGGTLGIDGQSATLDANGTLSFPFQVTDQPGVYRVIVIDPNAGDDSPYVIGVVQFEVPNPPE